MGGGSKLRSEFLVFGFLLLFLGNATSQLSPDYYRFTCPLLLPTVRLVMESSIYREPRMGASILRLFYLDCFVNGCDGSILLDDTADFVGEKNACSNANSVRGFDVIDKIKAAVEIECRGIVSCADILAIAARDSVAILGGPSWRVQLGRRDSLTASQSRANSDIPSPSSSFPELLYKFSALGLDVNDLVVLSGAHTLGLAKCASFRDRIYNDTNIEPDFAKSLRGICPSNSGPEDNNLATLDATTVNFDTSYFTQLLELKGLLHSDQELFKSVGSSADGLVQYYSHNPGGFHADFGVAMIKMGDISPLTGSNGQIRRNCRMVNVKKEEDY